MGSIGNFQEGWCDGRGIVEQVRTKLQKRQEGAINTERAIFYSISRKYNELKAVLRYILCFFFVVKLVFIVLVSETITKTCFEFETFLSCF